MPPKWRLCAGLSAVATAATYWPHAADALRYDRQLILSGEVWRLATSHLVHLNMPHLAMNLLALFLLCELLWRSMGPRQAGGLLAASAAGVSMLLLTAHSELAWYVGLSGVLHGFWAGCALHEILPGNPALDREPSDKIMGRRFALAALALLCAKLTLEFYFGPSQRTETAIGAPVIAVAHAYGALSGAVFFAAWKGIGLLKNSKDLLRSFLKGLLKDVASLRFRLK